MRKVLFTLLMCWLAGPLLAADAPWLTSVPDATAQAKKENKLVLLNFTGSDWCVACKRIDEEIFSKAEFTDYAKTNLVLVELDFPLQKKQSAALQEANEALRTQYKVDGFPTLIVLKPDGTVLWRQLGVPADGLKAVVAKLAEVKKK